ncbi:MAG: choice-of-anchor C family protein, partial [Pirellula sp.]
MSRDNKQLDKIPKTGEGGLSELFAKIGRWLKAAVALDRPLSPDDVDVIVLEERVLYSGSPMPAEMLDSGMDGGADEGSVQLSEEVLAFIESLNPDSGVTSISVQEQDSQAAESAVGSLVPEELGLTTSNTDESDGATDATSSISSATDSEPSFDELITSDNAMDLDSTSNSESWFDSDTVDNVLQQILQQSSALQSEIQSEISVDSEGSLAEIGSEAIASSEATPDEDREFAYGLPLVFALDQPSLIEPYQILGDSASRVEDLVNLIEQDSWDLYPSAPLLPGYETFLAGEGIGGWRVDQGSVDLLGEQLLQSPFQGRCLDLGGTRDLNSITCEVGTEIGKTYQLTMSVAGNWLMGDQSNAIEIAANDTTETVVLVADPMDSVLSTRWSSRTFSFVATSDVTSLQIRTLGNGVRGAVVSDLNLIEVPEFLESALDSNAMLAFDANRLKFFAKSEETPIDAAAASDAPLPSSMEPWTDQVTEFLSESVSKQVVFVQDNLADVDVIRSSFEASSNAAGTSFEVHVLQSDRDGLAQIAEYLRGESNIAAIQIYAHGSDGSLRLGSGIVDAETFAQYSEQLQAIGGSLSEYGDILIYGCNVAQGDLGRAFVEALASATGADIAASTDLTGGSQSGGDWELEYQTGVIDVASSVPEGLVARYRGLLATGTASADWLIGSSATETHDALAGNDVVIGGTNVAADGQFLQAANPGSLVNYSSGATFGGWTVTAGSVELIGTYWQSSPTGGRSIDMDGGAPGTIQQTLTTVVGNTYQVRFLMSANGAGVVTKALEASAAGTTNDFTITTASTHSTTAMDWQERFFTFTASSTSTTLQFKSLSPSGAQGAVLAEVVVADVTANNGNDTLLGDAGADTIIGSGGNDTINGGSENDWIRGGGGSETIDGGTGTDILVFGGSRADYRVAVSGSTYTFTDLRSARSDGVDIVTNIETFRFTDGDYTTADVALSSPIFENFDNGDLTGWTGGTIVTTSADFGPFLASAAAVNNLYTNASTLGIQNVQDVYKTFSLSGNQSSVTLSF